VIVYDFLASDVAFFGNERHAVQANDLLQDGDAFLLVNVLQVRLGFAWHVVRAELGYESDQIGHCVHSLQVVLAKLTPVTEPMQSETDEYVQH
jgi:hypothetical protein